jgi:hypothetical protein
MIPTATIHNRNNQTLIGYRQAVRAHLTPTIGHVSPRDLTAQHVQLMIGAKMAPGIVAANNQGHPSGASLRVERCGEVEGRAL